MTTLDTAAIAHHVRRGELTDQQLRWLLEIPHESRVQNLQGHSHLEGWDVRRWLIRVFGHGGWDQRVVSADLVAEWQTDEKRDKWAYNEQTRRRERTGEQEDVHYFHAIYRCTVGLDLRSVDGLPVATYEEVATGDAKGPSRGDAHDQALKGAATQALKRCAVNLGDLFGLNLYNKGRAQAVIGRTAVTDLRWGKADEPRQPDPPVEGSADPTRETTPGEPDTNAAAPPTPPPVVDQPAPDQAAAGGQPTFPPARGASRQEREEAQVLVDAGEKLAQRGAVEGWRKVWAQAKSAGLLDVVPSGATREENLVTTREHLHRYGLIANEVAAATPPAAGTGEVDPETARTEALAASDDTGEVDHADTDRGASLEQWAGVSG